MDPLTYYSRKEIKEQIVFNSQNREVSAMLGLNKFGKRPDTIQFDNDVLEMVKRGATSFHLSEEHWRNPLELKPGMSKKDLDNLRKGWDLVLDIDSPDLEDSKIIAHYLIEAIKFHDIKHISVKYSGNKGFHIAIPFKAFPSKVNDMETINLFPDGPKVIAEYLVSMIEPPLVAHHGESFREKIEIDTVLISNRHMFRAAYSLHEKSGLASIPIDVDGALKFDKETAKPENVKGNVRFLDDTETEQGEAASLITQAFDWHSKKTHRKEAYEELPQTKNKEYDELTEAIPEDYFPPDIKKGLAGVEDGRKRFLFILINFLKCTGWGIKELEARIWEWNKALNQPLKDGYVMSQLHWHRMNKKKVLPPNYANKAYYADMGLLPEENITRKFKNPVNYAIVMFKVRKPKKKKKKEKK
jgi:hypothetical protein